MKDRTGSTRSFKHEIQLYVLARRIIKSKANIPGQESEHSSAKK